MINSCESIHVDEQRQDNQLEPTYNCSVPTQDVTLTTNRKWWKIEKGSGRGLGISVLMGWHYRHVKCKQPPPRFELRSIFYEDNRYITSTSYKISTVGITGSRQYHPTHSWSCEKSRSDLVCSTIYRVKNIFLLHIKVSMSHSVWREIAYFVFWWPPVTSKFNYTESEVRSLSTQKNKNKILWLVWQGLFNRRKYKFWDTSFDIKFVLESVFMYTYGTHESV